MRDVAEMFLETAKAFTGLMCPSPSHTPNDIQGCRNSTFPSPVQLIVAYSYCKRQYTGRGLEMRLVPKQIDWRFLLEIDKLLFAMGNAPSASMLVFLEEPGMQVCFELVT